MILFRLKYYIKTTKPIRTLNLLEQFYRIGRNDNLTYVRYRKNNNKLEQVEMCCGKFSSYTVYNKYGHQILYLDDDDVLNLIITYKIPIILIKVTLDGQFHIEKIFRKPNIQHDKLVQINSVRNLKYQ